jgi:hypothetical protein
VVAIEDKARSQGSKVTKKPICANEKNTSINQNTFNTIFLRCSLTASIERKVMCSTGYCQKWNEIHASPSVACSDPFIA